MSPRTIATTSFSEPSSSAPPGNVPMKKTILPVRFGSTPRNELSSAIVFDAGV
jgi:hypothetical protein